jgi:hypothetical protein
MAELAFESRVTWWGRERSGTGVLTTGQQEVVFSAPSSMGGRGVGTRRSPRHYQSPREVRTPVVLAPSAPPRGVHGLATR